MAWMVELTDVDRFLPIFEPQFSSAMKESGSDLGRLLNGQTVTGMTLPKSVRQVSAHIHLPDFLSVRGIWLVHERFREIIEKLEPSMHQFFPIVLERPTGDQVADYYLFNAANHLDAVIVERSKAIWRKKSDGTRELRGFSREPDSVAMDRKMIADKHVWITPFVGKVFSEELMRAVDKAKLRSLARWHVLEANG